MPKNQQHIPINPILKIQKFPLGILIFRQKSFQFCIPRLKTRQPVLPYCAVCMKLNKWLTIGEVGAPSCGRIGIDFSQTTTSDLSAYESLSTSLKKKKKMLLGRLERMYLVQVILFEIDCVIFYTNCFVSS